jgi:DNA-binding response OmpR family regulator
VQEQNSPVILVVDDEKNAHSRVKYNLEQAGFGVLTAQSGKV